MRRMASIGLVLAAALIALAWGTSGAALAKDLNILSEKTATGFKFPESVACDAPHKTLYASQFGSELKPTQKDGKGKISKLSMDGKVVVEQFLPAAGQTLDKPKGLWIKGNRLWVTDIDVVWVFDLKSPAGILSLGIHGASTVERAQPDPPPLDGEGGGVKSQARPKSSHSRPQASPRRVEDAPSARVEDAPSARVEDAPSARVEDAPSAQSRRAFGIKTRLRHGGRGATSNETGYQHGT